VDLSGFDLLDSSKLRKKTMVPGHARGIPHPVLLAPKLGKLFGFRPSFAWDFHGEANIFVFILRDDQQQEVFRAPVRDKHYVYPADAPTLAPGKTYFWSIEVESPELTEPSEPVGFIVLGPEQRTEIEKKLAAISTVDPFQAGLARARLFTDYRVWYDAIAAYSDLITRFPGRLELYEERGTIYAQLPITSKLADRDFARVQDLKDARKTPN